MFKVGDKVRFKVEAYEHDINDSASKAYKRCVGIIGEVTHVTTSFKTQFPIEVDFPINPGVLFRECELAQPEPDFTFKTYRCEWQVVITQSDQEGRPISGSDIVLAKWPTYEQAYADLPNHGWEHKFVNGRWVPASSNSVYESLEVRYKEVLQ